MCRVWSGRPHNRYLRTDGWSTDGRRSGEGLGSSLLWVKWALDRAISFDLEPVFIGPLIAGHGMGDFGDFMGITRNSSTTIQDPEAFATATHQAVRFPSGFHDDWFRGEENRTMVVYDMNVNDISVREATARRDWGIPVSPPSSDARVCRFARQALRNMYWNAPRNHNRCRAFSPDLNMAVPSGGGEPPAYEQVDVKRAWVLAVHVRRGDVVRVGRRATPHSVFAAAVKSVLRGVAAVDPAAHVRVVVFSQLTYRKGRDKKHKLEPLELLDADGNVIAWDIEQEACRDVGLSCSQVRRYGARGACSGYQRLRGEGVRSPDMTHSVVGTLPKSKCDVPCVL